ncbi:hypothetical protein P692DRAFT_201807684 [Suillus brevipes Sb2]|nr:hypothetical protein P692DRAFT_201807684 [Suillus brevipes Sb2]
MTTQLNIFMQEEKVFTSLIVSFLPKQIPYKPALDSQDDHDASPDNSTSPLTTRWAYAASPWFPLVPLNPRFDSAIFEYLRLHSDAKLAKKVVLRSCNAFLRLVIAAACSWHIMSHLYRGSNHPWMALLINYPTCPILAEWVHELSHLFVGDLSANVPCTGGFIPSNCYPWELQLPILGFCKQDSAFNLNLCHYHPSKEAIPCTIEEKCLAVAHTIEGQRICETTWGQDNDAWDKFGGFLLCIRITKAEVLDTWGNYSNSTRLYDSFRDEWDMYDQLDPTSTPDGNWEEDQFDFSAPDIRTYFGHHEVAALSNYTKGIEHFITHLRFHLGFHLTASSTRTTRDGQNGSASTHGGAVRSNGGSTRPSGSTARSNPFESWVEKQKFIHICNIVGDSGKDVSSISDVQQYVITCFVGYLVTLPTSQLSEILVDHWDLAPRTPLSTLNAFIRVCYIDIPGHDRHYVIQPS